MPYSNSAPPTPAAGPSKMIAKKILAGRKCYRVSKTSNQVVWPPDIEEALIEGLEKYTPAESKSPRGLSRFPNRNKFIAQHILNKTGQIRTAKQVGSRIQQLRDTAAGKHIMKAYSDRHYEMMHPSRPGSSHQGSSAPVGGVPAVDGSSDGASEMVPTIPPVVQVYISVPPVAASPSSSSSTQWSASASASPTPSGRFTNVNVPHSGMYEFIEPRSLHTIDPTVTFASFSPSNLFSRFTIYRGNVVVHADQPTPMAVRAWDDTGLGGYLHYTKLAPGYWETLCGCSDLSPYTIVQEITKDAVDAAQMQKTATVMRVQYQFIQASSGQSRPLSPFLLNPEFDYEGDSGSEIFPFFASQALSTGSESPLRSDRSSSPSHSIPPGFVSQPISPATWYPQTHVPWQDFNTAATTVAATTATQLQPFPTSDYYGMQQQQQQQSAHHFQQQPSHGQQHAPSGQFYGSASF
ncbi:hypothetical protein GY45DRAFT_1435875 [Cubamyces sp. BRFM 1775]|nr:hypothetical protein GY45DRAFT_1435875 [Cubamyces sp. BRFM 1775]